jgi:hypothetical protein
MALNFVISDKKLKSALSDMVQAEIFDNFDVSVIRKSKISKTKLVEAMLDDTKFIKQIEKNINQFIDNEINDIIWESHSEALEKAYDEIGNIQAEEYYKQQRQNDLDRAAELLKKAGYKVTK